MNAAPIAVTGVGIVCPVGNTAAAAWKNLLAGRSGARTITAFDPTHLGTHFAGEVDGFDPADVLGKRDARRTDRYAQFAVAASQEALLQSGLRISECNADRVGVIVGTALGGMATFEDGVAVLNAKGPRQVDPYFLLKVGLNMASGQVALSTGARGPSFATVSACASGAHAMGEAMALIRAGVVDAVLAGGAEAAVTPLTLAAFGVIGALSTRNDAPASASRPFDRDRDGFVLGEGAAMLVLESLAHATQRGATILAVARGFGSTADSHHMVQPEPEGRGLIRAMRKAIDEAGIAPEEIDYVNAHGTSTPVNDRIETLAIKSVLGAHAYRTPISSTKSMTGHLLGAAGALEAAISVCALTAQCVPPTINYRTPDPACDLDCVPNERRPGTLRHVLTNSMGFGGHNASIVLSRSS